MKNKSIIGVVIGIIVLAIVLVVSSSNIIIDFMWFDKMGYLDVYLKKFISISKLMIPLFIIFMLIIWRYYRSIKVSIGKLKFIREVDVKKDKLEKKIFMISNILVSLFLSFNIAKVYWYKILQFTNASNFDIADPLYGMDIGFFIFKLPLIEGINGTIAGLVFFMILITIGVYFFSNMSDFVGKKNIEFKDIASGFTKFAGKHLAVLGLIFFLNMALGFLIRSWNLVYSSRGAVFGASYTDVMVTQKFMYVSMVMAIITGIVVFVGIIRNKYKLVTVFVVMMVALVPLEGIAAGLVQKFFVDSNALRVEEPYIKNNIEYTRKAYNLDKVQDTNFEIKNTLTYKDLEANKDTVDNIKITSFQPTLEYYRESQYIKKYYTFNDVDVDRYEINGEYNQVFLAPREIDINAVENKGNVWQNNHLVYTHGYGVVMNKVNELTEGRDPVFVMSRIPQYNTTGIQLDNPSIYFGEKTDQYVIVNTDVNEFYPGDNPESNIGYEGNSGIEMSFMNKVLFALKEGEMKFLLSKDIKSDSKILINRNVMKRVKSIAPFLEYDKDPYLFINEGRLFWMIDAYTVSSRYPFSERIGDINYVRNSVKAVVDAFTGDVSFYIVDQEDPILQTYAKIFPDMFKSEVPEGVKKHYRYASDLLSVQSKILGRYHVTDFEVFIKGEDVWEVAKDGNRVEQEDNLTDPVYMIMKLPGEDKAEMVLVNYFNVKGRYNMVGMIAAQMDGEDYGKVKLVSFKSDENSTIYSPTLFNKKVNQDVTISKELTLLDAKGSEIIYGDTMILPIKDSLLYVEPVYLRASGEKSIPQVRFIIVSYKDKIVRADNLQDALKQLFDVKGETEVKPTEPEDETKEPVKEEDLELSDDREELIKEANRVFQESEKAMKAGNWAEYGEHINRLKQILEKLDR